MIKNIGKVNGQGMMKIGSTEWKRLIRDGAKAFDIFLDKEKTDSFAIHAVELMKWTRKTNLTAIKDPLEVAVKHFLDSIAPVRLIPPNASMLDIGSGGGFPGIPLKILIPSLSVTLIDASRKKVSFLKHLIRTLGLEDIEARHIRAEDLSTARSETSDGQHTIFKKRFDVVICRALTSLDAFVLMALPLLTKEGIILALKSKMTEKEIESVRLLSITNPGLSEMGKDNFSVDMKKYTLPYLGSERSILTVKNWRSDGFGEVKNS